MTDNMTDGVSAPAVQETPALKSTDSSALNAIRAQAEAAPAAKAEPVQKAAPPQQEPEGEAGEVDDAPAADSPNDDGKKKSRDPRWVKERLERVRRVTAAETREQVLREIQQSQPQTREPTNVAPADREKTLEDFDFDTNAYFDYKVERGIERREQQAQQREAQQKQAEAVEQFKAKIDSFEDRVGAGAWEDINTSPLNTDPAFKPLVDLFLGDDNDLEVAHHLAMNMEEAQRLMALSPLARVREVAKLADQFSAPPKTAPAPPRKVTNAPPPPKTVSGGGKSTPSEDEEGITSAQRIAIWQAKRGKTR